MSGRARPARSRRSPAVEGAVETALLLVALAGLHGCAAPRTAATPVAFARHHAEQHTGDCRSPAGCTRIELRWPEITAAPTDAAKESLTAFVRAALLAPYEGGAPLSSPDSVMAQFIEAWRSAAGEFPESGGLQWRFDRRIEVLGDTLGVLSLAVTEASFAGGAHPNSTVRFTSFDTHRGAVLRLADFVDAARRDSLDALGERAFRRVRHLAPGQDLAAAGYWFTGGRFRLNENLALTPSGWLFCFNDYEVGPHSFGATELTLPWSEVLPLIRRDGPLGRRGRL